MTTAIQDLWPAEFGSEEVTPPVTILRQQATILGRRTRNLVEGDVVTEGTPTGSFKHTFYLTAPALDDYRYCLFYIHHEIKFYPLSISSCSGTGITCFDENQLLQALKDHFASDETRQVMSALIAQSKA